MLGLQINVAKMTQTKGVKSIQKMDFDNAPLSSLPAIISMINSGAKLERTARDLNAEKFQRQELTINIVPRQKDIGGEEDFVL